MKKMFALIALVAVAVVAVADVIKIDMADYGTSYTITNGAGSVQYKTVLIKYDNASTNTVTFSKTDANATFQIDTEVSSNAAAASDIWENPYTIPFEACDVFVVGTTDTNIVLEIITE